MLVVQRPRAIRNGGSVLIYQAQRIDELALAFGARPDLLRPLDFLLRDRNCRGRKGRVPKLVKVRHGHAPMCHRTPRIQFGHALKCIFGGGVGEGVKQSYTSVKLLLNCRQCRKSETILFPVSQVRCGCGFLVLIRQGKMQQQGEQYSP